MAIEVTRFEEEVLQKSYEIPVLTDFWAAWCQPCLMLGPILDRLAEKYAGRFVLAKVNVDHYPQIAAQYGIRGIPAVKLFHKGKIIAEFTGVKPQYELERWLEMHLPPPEGAPDIEQIEKLFNENRFQEAFELAKKAPDKLPIIWQIKLLFFTGNFSDVHELLPKLEAEHYLIKENLKLLLQYLTGDKKLPEEPLKELMEQALKNIKEKNWEEALKLLIDATMKNKNYAEELPRKGALAILNLLGIQNELNKKYRRKLEMAIF